MKTKDRSYSGFTLIEIMIVVAVIGLLLSIVVIAILLPARRASRIPPVDALRLE